MARALPESSSHEKSVRFLYGTGHGVQVRARLTAEAHRTRLTGRTQWIAVFSMLSAYSWDPRRMHGSCLSDHAFCPQAQCMVVPDTERAGIVGRTARLLVNHAVVHVPLPTCTVSQVQPASSRPGEFEGAIHQETVSRLLARSARFSLRAEGRLRGWSIHSSGDDHSRLSPV